MTLVIDHHLARRADPLSHLRCRKSATNRRVSVFQHPSPFSFHSTRQSAACSSCSTRQLSQLSQSPSADPHLPCMSSRKRQAEPLDTTRNHKHRRLSVSGRMDNPRGPPEVGTLGSQWWVAGKTILYLFGETLRSVIPCKSRYFLLYGAFRSSLRSITFESERRGSRL